MLCFDPAMLSPVNNTDSNSGYFKRDRLFPHEYKSMSLLYIYIYMAIPKRLHKTRVHVRTMARFDQLPFFFENHRHHHSWVGSANIILTQQTIHQSISFAKLHACMHSYATKVCMCLPSPDLSQGTVDLLLQVQEFFQVEGIQILTLKVPEQE